MEPQFSDFAGQSALIEKLAMDFQLGQFVHAYLFAGPAGIGKRSLAMLCVQTLYCEALEKPCGHCRGCKRAASGSLSDVHILQPATNSITIGQIRELIETIQMRAFEGGTKVVIIEAAERMTTQAQNCLLKTLEQPPGDTVFFLLCETTSAVLPTVLSRCRVVTLRPLTGEAMLVRLLAHGLSEPETSALVPIAQGIVGKALSMASDERQQQLRRKVAGYFGLRATTELLAAAAPFKGERALTEEALSLLQEALADAIRHRFSNGGAADDTYPAAWREYAEQTAPERMLKLASTIVKAKKMLHSNVQTQTVMETVLLEIMEGQHGSCNRNSI